VIARTAALYREVCAPPARGPLHRSPRER
jgi:hypothetical protein